MGAFGWSIRLVGAAYSTCNACSVTVGGAESELAVKVAGESAIDWAEVGLGQGGPWD